MNMYIYILAMALTTYLIRVLPMTLFRRPIRSRFVRSFLYYVPYACLSAMTFPAILSSTESVISEAAALVTAVILAFRGKSLIVVALASSTAVFLTELCRFIRPDRIEIEDPRGAFPDGGVLASLLPMEAEVVSNRDGLTVAEEGAALAGRRMLWEKVLGKDMGRK